MLMKIHRSIFHFDVDPDPDPAINVLHMLETPQKFGLFLFTAVLVYLVSSFSSSGSAKNDAHMTGFGFTTPAEFNLGPKMCTGTYLSGSNNRTLIFTHFCASSFSFSSSCPFWLSSDSRCVPGGPEPKNKYN
jgi:hypothetical protein